MILWVSDKISPNSYKAKGMMRNYLLEIPQVIWIKSYEEFVDIVNKKVPSHIFIDHDLDDEHRQRFSEKTYNEQNFKVKTGLDCLEWIYDTVEREQMPNIFIHSDNYIGLQKMKNLQHSKIYKLKDRKASDILDQYFHEAFFQQEIMNEPEPEEPKQPEE